MAHLWDAPSPPTEAELQAAAAHGLPREALLSAVEQQPPLGIWPENWPGLQLFLAMATQWRLSPAGHRTGLDYAALPAVQQQLRQHGRKARAAVAGMQIMEAEWLKRVRAKASAG